MGRSSSTLRLKQILSGCSHEDLKEASVLAARDLGFARLMFSGSFSKGLRGELAFDNFPAEWHRHCAARGRDLLPGTARRLALQEVTPLLWSRAVPAGTRSFTKARQLGLAAGVSCSVRGPRGEWSLTSFALSWDGPAAEHHITVALPECQLIACAIHYAAARIARRTRDRALLRRPASGQLLSERESQCLIESARGKTTSAIGDVLQISERTVAFHLANARRKLDAANSRHAVTKALSLKLIEAS
jgi:DNA-binding CsgD family transcriptional regulator